MNKQKSPDMSGLFPSGRNSLDCLLEAAAGQADHAQAAQQHGVGFRLRYWRQGLVREALERGAVGRVLHLLATVAAAFQAVDGQGMVASCQRGAADAERAVGSAIAAVPPHIVLVERHGVAIQEHGAAVAEVDASAEGVIASAAKAEGNDRFEGNVVRACTEDAIVRYIVVAAQHGAAVRIAGNRSVDHVAVVIGGSLWAGTGVAGLEIDYGGVGATEGEDGRNGGEFNDLHTGLRKSGMACQGG